MQMEQFLVGTTVNEVAFKDAGVMMLVQHLQQQHLMQQTIEKCLWTCCQIRANQANKGKEFTVTYYAKVNKAAVVTEKNKAQLEYGNKPGETTTTTPSEVKTPTYPLDILKVKKDSN